MNIIQNVGSNALTSLYAGGIGSLAYYSFFDYGYYPLPIVDYDIPTFLVYGGVIAASSMLLRQTGDFILPLVSNNVQVNNLSKITIPLSVGVISLGGIFIINGFNIPNMDISIKTLLLSSGSYISADWLSSKMLANNNMSGLIKKEDKPIPLGGNNGLFYIY
jgi:hypothetical protein